MIRRLSQASCAGSLKRGGYQPPPAIPEPRFKRPIARAIELTEAPRKLAEEQPAIPLWLLLQKENPGSGNGINTLFA
jgi:hypothetical protein